jgi:hypothetical protein
MNVHYFLAIREIWDGTGIAKNISMTGLYAAIDGE